MSRSDRGGRRFPERDYRSSEKNLSLRFRRAVRRGLLRKAIEPVTGLTMVEPPLPAVGQDAPVSIRVPEIGVDLIVWILIIKQVASVLRLSIKIA